MRVGHFTKRGRNPSDKNKTILLPSYNIVDYLYKNKTQTNLFPKELVNGVVQTLTDGNIAKIVMDYSEAIADAFVDKWDKSKSDAKVQFTLLDALGRADIDIDVFTDDAELSDEELSKEIAPEVASVLITSIGRDIAKGLSECDGVKWKPSDLSFCTAEIPCDTSGNLLLTELGEKTNLTIPMELKQMFNLLEKENETTQSNKKLDQREAEISEAMEFTADKYNNALAYRIVDYLMDMADYFETDEEERDDAVAYVQECLDSGEVSEFVEEIQERIDTAKEELQRDKTTWEHKRFYSDLLADGEELLKEISDYSRHSITEGIIGKDSSSRRTVLNYLHWLESNVTTAMSSIDDTAFGHPLQNVLSAVRESTNLIK